MSVGKTEEDVTNGKLGEVLDRKLPAWDVIAEQTNVLEGSDGRPDVVGFPKGSVGNPVLVEAKYVPAATVEQDAAKRIGEKLENVEHVIDKVIAVKYPLPLKTVKTSERETLVLSTTYEYCLLSAPSKVEHGDTFTVTDLDRFPEQGWIEGDVDALAAFCELTSLNEHALNEAVKKLQSKVKGVTGRLREALEGDRQGVLNSIASGLHQEDSEQTTRMAVTIIANAFLFQNAIAGTCAGDDYMIPSPDSHATRLQVLDIWARILEYNYWPIFAIARKVLTDIPTVEAQSVISSLTELAEYLALAGLTSAGDMTGQMFGKLIADRKFLATFYTRSESAHLLAELAVERLTTNWCDENQVKELRVADLACGTGTLLTAAYQRIMSRLRRCESINDRLLHPHMIENVLVGADIMPAAVHLTATLLSSVYPRVTFGDTRIALMPYGKEDINGEHVQIGSLELLDDNFAFRLGSDIFAAEAGGAISGNSKGKSRGPIANSEADLVIMNPPFTRTTGQEAESVGIPNPAFAGFGNNEAEQQAMSKRLNKLSRKLETKAGHGNAGLGSSFLDLAHIKTKPGSVIAFVLPFTAVGGKDWSSARQLLANHYTNITIISIATTGSTDRAFSADTGIAEILIVATRTETNPATNQNNKKPNNNDNPSSSVKALLDTQVLYVNLEHRPANLVEGVEIARKINHIALQTPKTAPWGKIPSTGNIKIGSVPSGNFIRASLADSGAAGTNEPELAGCAARLTRGVLQLPRNTIPETVTLTKLKELGVRGPYHMDISGYTLKNVKKADGTTKRNKYGTPEKEKYPRGPFDIKGFDSAKTWQDATYPVLWAHDHTKETCLTVTPDSQGRIRPDYDTKAAEIWATATRLHFNRDFRLNSQPLAACLTPEPCIGGTAWPSFILHLKHYEPPKKLDDDQYAKYTVEHERWEKTLTLWANTTLGLIGWWWIATRQQQGRARLTISRLGELPVLDPRQLTPKQLEQIDSIYADFATRQFLPANETYQDNTRQDLDKAILIDLLGCDKTTVLPSLTTLRRQWCNEPSVHGNKNTRPA